MAIVSLIMNNRITLVKNLSDSIDSTVYCDLIDQGLDPGEAWVLTFESDFDIIEDVMVDPAFSIDELV